MAPISSRNQFPELLNGMGLTGDAVEIGTHRGDYARIIANQWKGEKLWCVDPWRKVEGYEAQEKLLWGGAKTRDEDHEEAQRYLGDYIESGKVSLIKGTSAEAVKKFTNGWLDFAYVDGDHRRAHVTYDLRAWWEKLKPGGILAGHDWIQPGETHRWALEVQDALRDFLRNEDVDVQLVVEEGGLPWSYYMVKQ